MTNVSHLTKSPNCKMPTNYCHQTSLSPLLPPLPLFHFRSPLEMFLELDGGLEEVLDALLFGVLARCWRLALTIQVSEIASILRP